MLYTNSAIGNFKNGVIERKNKENLIQYSFDCDFSFVLDISFVNYTEDNILIEGSEIKVLKIFCLSEN